MFFANTLARHCTVTTYQKRIPCPFPDRIDIHIEVPRMDYENLSGDRMGDALASIQARVQAARDMQTRRFSKIESVTIARWLKVELGM